MTAKYAGSLLVVPEELGAAVPEASAGFANIPVVCVWFVGAASMVEVTVIVALPVGPALVAEAWVWAIL
jgi:hypothetical protein